MANVYMQIRCGMGHKDMVVGREYDFSVGEEGTKISPADMMVIVEQMVMDGLRAKYGIVYELR